MRNTWLLPVSAPNDSLNLEVTILGRSCRVSAPALPHVTGWVTTLGLKAQPGMVAGSALLTEPAYWAIARPVQERTLFCEQQ
jgi:hypothetical protein